MRQLSCAIALLSLGLLRLGSEAYAQPYSTGPFPDETAYQTAVQDKTTTISGMDVVGVVRGVELTVADEVDGNCWNNSSAVAARFRVELEKFGIEVYQEELAFRTLFFPLMTIHALGYRQSNGVCAGFVELTVSYWGESKLGSLSYTDSIYNFNNAVVIWHAGSVVTNSNGLDDAILELAQEWVDTLIADISKARRSPDVEGVLSTWAEPSAMTQVEFEEIIKQYSPTN